MNDNMFVCCRNGLHEMFQHDSGAVPKTKSMKELPSLEWKSLNVLLTALISISLNTFGMNWNTKYNASVSFAKLDQHPC